MIFYTDYVLQAKETNGWFKRKTHSHSVYDFINKQLLSDFVQQKLFTHFLFCDGNRNLFETPLNHVKMYDLIYFVMERIFNADMRYKYTVFDLQKKVFCGGRWTLL